MRITSHLFPTTKKSKTNGILPTHLEVRMSQFQGTDSKPLKQTWKISSSENKTDSPGLHPSLDPELTKGEWNPSCLSPTQHFCPLLQGWLQPQTGPVLMVIT